MQQIIKMIRDDRSNCCGCQACANICPKQAITMQEDTEGFLYPSIDEYLCINCGACDRTCPGLNPIPEQGEPVAAYAYMNPDMQTRMNSSSGGVFAELANLVLDRGGYVFGAAFNEQWEVGHIAIHDKSKLDRLQRSKYVQSNVGMVYRQVKQLLKSDMWVLFTGTPCQIEGLHAYLGKCSYNKLIIVDFICHGVPSPSVWRDYVKLHREGEEIRRISFRNKNLSWERYLLLFEFSHNNKYLAPLDKDLYLQGFLQDFYLRPACYSCQFKKKHRLSDITMADFWGIDNVLPDWNDHKGTSLVIIHSNKGKQIFDAIPGRRQEVSLDQAIRYNPAMIMPPQEPAKRVAFFQEYKAGVSDLLPLLQKYTRRPLKQRLKQHAFSLAHHLLPKPVRTMIKKIIH